jgi:serine/threonine protein kinase
LLPDIKPDIIIINYRGTGPETIIKQVQIIDLENAAYLPKGRSIKGMLAGNESWRSPEGHFKGELNKPSDIFSFAVVVSSPS